jgi:hypothetical protein
VRHFLAAKIGDHRSCREKVYKDHIERTRKQVVVYLPTADKYRGCTRQILFCEGLGRVTSPAPPLWGTCVACSHWSVRLPLSDTGAPVGTALAP